MNRPLMAGSGLAGLLGLAALLTVFAVGTSQASSTTPAGDTSLPHLDLRLSLDPATRQLHAEATLTQRGGGPLRFSLAPGFELTQLELNGRELAPTPHRRVAGQPLWRFDGGTETSVLRLRYHGELAELDQRIDHRGVLRGLPPMASPDGSYLPAGSGWYPRLPGLFSYRLRLRLPPGQVGIAPGRLVEESVDPTRGLPAIPYQAEFDFPYPADGIELMAGPYAVSERMLVLDERALRLRSYFHDDLSIFAEDYLHDSEAYIRLYSAWIGAYPFAGFSVVSSPLPTGFGMPGMTYLGRQVIRLPFIRATSLGHEVLHNWWGNGVYPDWNSGNWSEGLTTFMADYHYQERRSAEDGREARRVWLRDFAAVPAAADRPLTAFTGRAHAADGVVGYGKAAMLFYMLRARIGQEAFDAGLRDFWQAHRFSTASWEDLRIAFENRSGQALEAFFQQWLSRTGAAEVSIVAATRPSDTTLELTLAQGSPPYQLDLPVSIRTAQGELRRVIRLDQPRQSFRLELPATALAVRLDPDFEIWRTLAAAERPATLRQVMLAARPRVHLAGGDSAFHASAQALAARLLETPASHGELAADQAGVLIVPDDQADARLAALGLPPTPAHLRDRGDARAWALVTSDGAPRLVVSARDAQALAALRRGLPHYGQQSWVIFAQGKAIARGVWPAAETWREVAPP